MTVASAMRMGVVGGLSGSSAESAESPVTTAGASSAATGAGVSATTGAASASLASTSRTLAASCLSTLECGLRARPSRLDSASSTRRVEVPRTRARECTLSFSGSSPCSAGAGGVSGVSAACSPSGALVCRSSGSS
ncbi:Uncharacterised protein [Mycobacteroides abscessus subsp. abscessus]|nr:Uncharacterised protein [Mycobacteroides abscessus subsp. abscessus]